MNQANHQKELERLLEKERDRQAAGEEAPTLFLHSCCAPCSSYVLEYLCQLFRITVFFYNPNITQEAEYRRRAQEQKRLIEAYNREGKGYPIRVEEGDYDPACFFRAAAGLEQLPEGGQRCERCFALRLSETARRAAACGSDYFCTTLTISPLKNAEKLNQIGQEMAAVYGVSFLPSDFKKRDGYKRSVELSQTYGLYRQDYCGCSFSKSQGREGGSGAERSLSPESLGAVR